MGISFSLTINIAVLTMEMQKGETYKALKILHKLQKEEPSPVIASSGEAGLRKRSFLLCPQKTNAVPPQFCSLRLVESRLWRIEVC
jgi:hypothetical protein